MFYCVFDTVADEDDDEASPEIMNNSSRSVPMETDDDRVTTDTSRSNNSNTAIYHRRQGHETRDSNRATNQLSLRSGRSEEMNGSDDGRTGNRATGIRRWFSWFNTSNRKNRTGEEIPSHEVQGEASRSRPRGSSSSDQEIFHSRSSFRRGFQATRDEQDYSAQYPWYFGTPAMTRENNIGVQEESRPILSDHLMSHGCSSSFVDQQNDGYGIGHERFELPGSIDVPHMQEKQRTKEGSYEVRINSRSTLENRMEIHEDVPSFLDSFSNPFIPASKTSIPKTNDNSAPPSINTNVSYSTGEPEDTIYIDDEGQEEEVPGGTIPDVYALIVRTLNLGMSHPTVNEPDYTSSKSEPTNDEFMDSQTPPRKYSEDMNVEDEFTKNVPEHSSLTLHRLHTEWPKDHVNIEVLIGLKEPKNSFEALAVQEFMAKENLASISGDATMSVYQHSSKVSEEGHTRMDSGVGSRDEF